MLAITLAGLSYASNGVSAARAKSHPRAGDADAGGASRQHSRTADLH